MTKIILEKNLKFIFKYDCIFENLLRNISCQLGVFVDVINSAILTRIISESNVDVDLRVDKVDDFIIRYEDLEIDTFYIAFYDTFLDRYWEKVCETKHPGHIFVWDQETPMLRFSKENFEQILKIWKIIVRNNPQYLIITQDDTGWIDVQAKNELDSDELRMIDEYKQYQEKLRAEERERISKRNQKIN